MQLYCSRSLNTAYRFYWRSIGLCYANPPLSRLGKVLTKIGLEGASVVVCTPNWGTTREHAYWRRLPERITVRRTELPNGPIYVPGDSQGTMPAPEWGSLLSIIDGSLDLLPMSDLDQEVRKESMAKNRGLTILDLKKRSEYSSVTTTSGEFSNEQETRAVPTPVAETVDHLSEITSSMQPVDLEVLTLKYIAFAALLLMKELDLRESTPRRSHDHSVFPMRSKDGPYRSGT